MFVSLSRILVWLVLGTAIYYVLVRFIPKENFLGRLGGALLLIFLLLAFLTPNDQFVSAAWDVVSFPLKPLGGAILLLFFASRKVKGQDRSLIIAALLILLFASVPAVAYFLTQVPPVTVQNERGSWDIARDSRLPSSTAPEGQTGKIVLLGQATTEANLQARTQKQVTNTGDRILYAASYQEQQNFPNNSFGTVSADLRQDLEGNRVVEAKDVATLFANQSASGDWIVVKTTGADIASSALAVQKLLGQHLKSDSYVLIPSASNVEKATLASNNLEVTAISRPVNFYLLQVETIPRRGLRPADFVPSAETLALSTRVWEEYLSSIQTFLRGQAEQRRS